MPVVIIGIAPVRFIGADIEVIQPADKIESLQARGNKAPSLLMSESVGHFDTHLRHLVS
jgi:hypothetical protein